MPQFYRDQRFGPNYAANFTPVSITLTQMRALIATYEIDVDAVVASLASAVNWYKTPAFDVWVAPDSTFNPTAFNNGAIANAKTTHRRG